MIENQLLTEEQIRTKHQEIDQLIDEAERFALESPEPDPSTVLDNVFDEGDQ